MKDKQLKVVYPPPISCFYYYIEEKDGGHKITYMFKQDENTLSFPSIYLKSGEPMPCFKMEKMPKELRQQNIIREFLNRT